MNQTLKFSLIWSASTMSLVFDIDFLQVASCAKCRYQYELVSGDVVNIESEEIRLVCKYCHEVSYETECSLIYYSDVLKRKICFVVLILAHLLLLRISSWRTQHGCSSLEKVAGISSNNKAKNSLCCPFYCGIIFIHNSSTLKIISTKSSMFIVE